MGDREHTVENLQEKVISEQNTQEDAPASEGGSHHYYDYDNSQQIFDEIARQNLHDVAANIRDAPAVLPAAGFASRPPELVREEVKGILDAVENPEKLHLNEDEDKLLTLLLNKIGLNATTVYGMGACETYVWLNPRLMPAGWWIDEDILSHAQPEKRELLSQPEPSSPNVDLVGALWSKSGKNYLNHHHHDEQSSKGHNPWNAKSEQPFQQRSLYWMELRSVIEDPYQTHGLRLEALCNAGLERAAGITFNVFGICGMVVWYAKANSDPNLLTDIAHETYLRRASHMKGAVLATLDARRNCIGLLEQSDEIIGLTDSGNMLPARSSSLVEEQQCCPATIECQKLPMSVRAWPAKIRGGGAQIPPCMAWGETLWTLFGSFIGFLFVAFLHEAVRILSDQEYFLILGPFAAITMLQYGLPGAPAAQPRTILAGQVIAGVVAVPLSYIPESILPKWLRMILAPTLAIGIMMKSGVPCPPSAANSLLYAKERGDWKLVGLTVLCSVISIFPAIAYNNLNPRRQYPTFWGFLPKAIISKRKKREK